MVPIIRWELSRRRSFVIWWSVGTSALIAITVLAYLSFKNDIPEFSKSMSDLTDSLGTFFGGTDFFSPIGYLSSQIYYMLLPILLIVMAVVLVSGILSRDESDLTIELTLARPVSRLRVIAAKAVAALIIMGIVCAVTYGVMALCVAISGLDVEPMNVLLTHLLCFAFATMFGAISFALVAFSRVTRPIASAVAITLGVGGYVIASLGGYMDFFKQLAKAFPYHYYNTMDLLVGKVDTGLLVYIGVAFTVCIVLSIVGYRRRDIG